MTSKLAAAACGAAMGIAFTLSAVWNAAMATDSAGTSAPVASPARSASRVEATPLKVDPLADKLLTRTCEVLGSANALSFHAEVLFDQVLPSAVKVQFAGGINFALQRPDELAIDYQSDLGGKQLWYQHDTLTILDRQHLMYASMTVPDSIDSMLDRAAKMHNLTLPLSNLAYSDPCLRIRKQIIFGTYVGVNDVNGVGCDHLAFSSSEIDFQVWLDRSARPVPRKIVINYRSEPGSPEYIAVLSNWKFPGQIPASQFRYRLPRDAKRIEFLKVKVPQP
jgi:hypothetical protein